MFAVIGMLLSQFKVIVVGIALVSGTTVAVVVDQVASSRGAGSELAEFLAEHADECGPVTALTAAELAALQDATSAELEAFFAARFAACDRDDDDDDDTLSAEELAAYLARFTEECGPDAVPPTAEELAVLDEDDAEELFESLIEECDEALSADELAALLARFTEKCGPDAVPPTAEELAGLTEDEAEELFESLIEACQEAAATPTPTPTPSPTPSPTPRLEDDEDDDEDEDESESESGGGSGSSG